jgi:beta-glucanase (GH16 family)
MKSFKKILRPLSVLIFLTSSMFVFAEDSWKLVWSDEFNGVTGLPSASDWVFDACPCYNEEQQNYTVNSTNNARIDGAGNLVIEVKKETSGGKPFSSARLISKNGWTYGRMEVRAKLPDGKFLWPAIWMLPQTEKYGTWPNSGEIDIMENWNRGWDQNAIFGTLHTQPFSGGGAKQGRTELNSPSLPSDNFHVYAVEWYKDQIRFFVDDKVFYTYYNESLDFNTAFPFDSPFHLILNVAVEKAATGSEVWAKRTMEIDYVRVYQGTTQGPAYKLIAIPGVLEAENFFDQYKVLNENNSFDSGLHVAYIDTNDWMDYKINVQASGSYTSTYKVASPSGGELQLLSGGSVLETIKVPSTGGYDTWITVKSATPFILQPGEQILRVRATTGGFNFDKLQVFSSVSESSSSSSSGVTSSASSISSSFSSSISSSLASSSVSTSSNVPAVSQPASSGGGSMGGRLDLIFLGSILGLVISGVYRRKNIQDFKK